MLCACGPAEDEPGARTVTIPPRTAPEDGLPDTCELLRDADPAALLNASLSPARRIFQVCLVTATDSDGLDRSVSVEVRRTTQGRVPADEEQFFEDYGAGVYYMGGERSGVRELPGEADYALWFPIDQGIQLHAFWGGAYILVVTVRGAPLEPALALAQGVIRPAIGATRAASEEPPAPSDPQPSTPAPGGDRRGSERRTERDGD